MSGKAIKDAGFTKVIGYDGSQEMLNNVPDGIYVEKKKFFLGKDEFPSDILNTVDLLVGSAILEESHMPYTFFSDILPLLKKGGLMMLTARAAIYDNEAHLYKAEGEKLIEAGKMKLVDRKHYSVGTKYAEFAET